MAEFMLVFAALCLVTAIHIRIRDLEAEKETREREALPLQKKERIERGIRR